MNYGVILASGKGTRIKDECDIPKQFRCINGIPVVIYPIRSMLDIKRFDAIFVAVPEDYVEYMNNLVNSYFDDKEIEKVIVISGGKERMDSINNVIDSISKNNIGDEDVVVIHDGVRPFVTDKILNDSIDKAREYGAVVASMPVSDTLLISSEGDKVDDIPKRSLYYKGQAPDSFNIKLFIKLLSNLSEEQKKVITGTSQVCTLNNYPIHMIEGDEINFKITTLSDFTIAEAIAKEREEKCLVRKKFQIK